MKKFPQNAAVNIFVAAYQYFGLVGSVTWIGTSPRICCHQFTWPLLAPLIGAKTVQEVVAVSAAVEKLHPDVNFVSEIGGEDMKTLFFTPSGDGKSKQVYMQSACSGGTGTFIEKTARKLQVSPERLADAFS